MNLYYKQQQQKKKEIQYSDTQKFLQFSLVAPSKQLNFMPNTYPGLPSYFQQSIEQLMASKKRHDQTIEIQDLISINQDKHEQTQFQQQFPPRDPYKQQPIQAINRQAKAGMSIIQPFKGNISKMGEFVDPTLRSFQGEEISIIGMKNNQTVQKVEQNILNAFNMQEEVDKIYQKLIK